MFHKNLIPLYLYTGHPLPRPARLYDYALTAQGLVKRLETLFVSADLLLAPIDTPLTGLQLADYPLQPVRFKLPRIPAHLLREVLVDARQNLNLEFLYHFRFDPTRRHWSVTRPQQDSAHTRVGYTTDPTGIVLDLHSHHVMAAFFSPTDDRDERGGRFYGVMGHLERDRPELALRLGLHGHWCYNIPALTLFDDITPFIEVHLEHAAIPAVAPAESHSWLTQLFSRRR